jgi:uncharacterized protein YneF (UPF0154 family)
MMDEVLGLMGLMLVCGFVMGLFTGWFFGKKFSDRN